MSNEQTRNEGLAWHVWHNRLLSWCHDIAKRREDINVIKPKDELPIRHRLLKRVRGDLPKEVAEACLKRNEAYRVEASNAHEPTSLAFWDTEQNLVEVLLTHKDAIEALHAQECPDCPWNGETIFPEVEGD